MQFDRLKRREFITLLGGAAAAWPLAASAQQPPMPVIGFLDSQSRTFADVVLPASLGRGTRGALHRDCGRIHPAQGRCHCGTPATMALMQATSVTPIVFATAGDPVGNKLVASLARPGGNVTGLSVQSADIAGKRLELLREVVPGLVRVAIMGNVDNPFTVLELDEVRTAAGKLGLEVATFGIRRAQDIVPAFEALKSRSEALYVCTDALAGTNRIRINILAVGARLPTMHGSRDYVEAGGLMSYGANYPSLFRRSADYVDKILRGAKPASLPVEQPTKFDLIINLTAAKALGLTVPASLLAVADELIE